MGSLAFALRMTFIRPNPSIGYQSQQGRGFSRDTPLLYILSGFSYNQTCQVSRNFRESPEITPDLQVSRKCPKISRNLGNSSDFFCLSKKSLFLPYLTQNVCLYHEYHSMWGKNVILQQKITENVCYYPPPLNRVGGFWRTRKNSATTPPPLNRVDFWRSRKRLKKFNNINLAALYNVR